MSEIRVTNVLGENGNSPVNFTKGINMSGIVTATSFVPTVGQLSHRNIFINGAMTVAQRGVSSTTNGYGSVDRYYVGYNAVQEAPTQAQADISAGTTPYTLGFRKSLKITNGNQTSGAGAGEYIFINMPQEAQNLATSGWNYKSSSSFITLSFWIKSSVAQNFFFQFDVRYGTRQNYTMETGSLTADTWTKITKVIPGNSNLTIDNDNGVGAYITFGVFWGTNYTASISLETWGAASDSAKTPDNPTNWYNTNDATLEITGIQLEVGSVATPFEHLNFADELRRCSRYYQKIAEGNAKAVAFCFNYSAQYADWVLQYPMGPMRASPTLDQVNGADYYYLHGGTGNSYLDGAFLIEHQQPTQANIYFDPDAGLSAGGTGYLRTSNNSAYLALSSEL